MTEYDSNVGTNIIYTNTTLWTHLSLLGQVPTQTIGVSTDVGVSSNHDPPTTPVTTTLRKKRPPDQQWPDRSRSRGREKYEKAVWVDPKKQDCRESRKRVADVDVNKDSKKRSKSVPVASCSSTAECVDVIHRRSTSSRRKHWWTLYFLLRCTSLDCYGSWYTIAGLLHCVHAPTCAHWLYPWDSLVILLLSYLWIGLYAQRAICLFRTVRKYDLQQGLHSLWLCVITLSSWWVLVLLVLLVLLLLVRVAGCENGWNSDWGTPRALIKPGVHTIGFTMMSFSFMGLCSYWFSIDGTVVKLLVPVNSG